MRELDWINWWATPWEKALEEWWPPLLKALDAAQLETLRTVSPNSFLRAFDITPYFPDQPNNLVLRLVNMNSEEWTHLHHLSLAVCSPSKPSPLSEGQRIWCERFAKGVRPGRWLNEGDDPFFLLKLWLNEPAWERVRLVLPREHVAPLESLVPAEEPSKRQLRIFWESLIWRVLGTE